MEEEWGCCGLPSWAFFRTEAASRTVSASAALHLKPLVSVARVCHGSACFPGYLCKQALPQLGLTGGVFFLPKACFPYFLWARAGKLCRKPRSLAPLSQEAWPHFPAFSSRTARCCKQALFLGLSADRRKHSLQCICSSANQRGLEREVVFHVRQQA